MRRAFDLTRHEVAGFQALVAKKRFFFFYLGPWLSLVFKRFKQESRVFLTRFFALFFAIVH